MATNGPNLGVIEYETQGVVWYTALKALLRGLDGLVQPAVEDKDLSAPPVSPANGDRYLVGATATGDWAGHEDDVARYQSSDGTGWEFFTPSEGWTVYVRDENKFYIYDGAAWAADPAGSGIPETLIDAAGDLIYGSAADTAAKLTGNTTTTKKFLRSTGDGTNATAPAWDTVAATDLPNSIRDVAVPFIIDGGGSAITTGVKGFIEVPFGGTIVSVRLLADQSGSIVVDVWKDTYANYPPTVADTITASAKPTLSSATKSQDTTLTGWTTSVTAGDILGFNVDSITTCQRVTVSLVIRRS